ncbi:MAG TPA: VOC family protein [Candidatus Kapabacteria bacterium]|nr:VOC family protein [Candidatus Kapabacteria bacterium]
MVAIKLAQFILFVSDQSVSRDFYQNILQLEPVLDVPGMTEFLLSDASKLGLMPEKGIATIIDTALPHPQTAHGIPRCELYLYVENVDECFERSIRFGARVVSPVSIRDWGDIVGYVTDPDGHLIAFASTISE